MTIDIIAAIWRDEINRLTWEAWLGNPASVSWIGLRPGGTWIA